MTSLSLVKESVNENTSERTSELKFDEDDWSNRTLYDFLYSNMPSGWEKFFEQEEVKVEISLISDFLHTEVQEKKKLIWPELPHVLNAFYMCPEKKMKCVILGQDPYHTPNTAYGLSFSSYPGGQIPPSLRNIFRKLLSEGYSIKPTSGYLEKWAREGVLLLNTALTVVQGCPESHLRIWEKFTEQLMNYLYEKESLVWILWGKKATKYRGYCHPKSLLLEGGHPSPINTTGSFFSSNYFSPCNDYLSAKKITPIDWNLS
jgi:uracil-DNA glycosylase